MSRLVVYSLFVVLPDCYPPCHCLPSDLPLSIWRHSLLLAGPSPMQTISLDLPSVLDWAEAHIMTWPKHVPSALRIWHGS